LLFKRKKKGFMTGNPFEGGSKEKSKSNYLITFLEDIYNKFLAGVNLSRKGKFNLPQRTQRAQRKAKS